MVLATNVTGFGSTVMPPAAMQETEIVKLENVSSLDKDEQEEKKEEKKITNSITVEEYVRNYFSDIPVMIEVAKCESRFRQHDKSGEVLRGEKNEFDRGVMQINEFYHDEDSEKLGYDIMTLEGNTAYARYLFEKYGVKPWKSSSKCWAKTVAYSEYKNLAIQ